MIKRLIIAASIALTTNQVHGAPTCSGLIGTWKATYTFNSTFTDTFIIKSISSAGLLAGINQYQRAMYGFCKNGTVYLSEKYGNQFLMAYYFTNMKPNFGRTMVTVSYSHDFDPIDKIAYIRKTSAATKVAEKNQSEFEDNQIKLFEINAFIAQ